MFSVPAALRFQPSSGSRTQKPNPLVRDPVQNQGQAVNRPISLYHHYNQHDQNTVVVLPGDLVFSVKSRIHENVTTNDTLLLRSLPSLNTLLRDTGPDLSRERIWDMFKFLGVCEFDWAVDTKRPLLRGICITHAGRMRTVNLFDDVSELQPKVPINYPRHAYLWLRPFVYDQRTGSIVPFNDIDAVMAHEARQRPAAAAAEDAEAHNAAAAVIVDPSMMMDPDEDADHMLAELERWGAAPDDDAKQPQNRAAGAANDDAKSEASTVVAQPHLRAERHPFFWQYVPVCSTHADLHTGGASAVMRPDAGRRRLFQMYPQVIYLGLLYSEPRRGRPNQLDTEVMQFTIHGPFGSRAIHDDVLLQSRHLLRVVDLEYQYF